MQLGMIGLKRIYCRAPGAGHAGAGKLHVALGGLDAARQQRPDVPTHEHAATLPYSVASIAATAIR